MPAKDRKKPPQVILALDVEEHWLVFAENSQNTASRSHFHVNEDHSTMAKDPGMFMALFCG